jgi:hypothetical protein
MPILQGIGERLQSRIIGTGFQEQHGPPGVLREPRREHASC